MIKQSGETKNNYKGVGRNKHIVKTTEWKYSQPYMSWVKATQFVYAKAKPSLDC